MAVDSAGGVWISDAVNQLDKAAQQNASGSEQLAATAEELNGQAMQLQQVMAFFKVDTKQSPAVKGWLGQFSKPTPVNRTAQKNIILPFTSAGISKIASKPIPATRAGGVKPEFNENDFERF